MRALSVVFLKVLVILPLFGILDPVNAQMRELQYKAAVTKAFIWRYVAFPVFRLNPVFPGEVVNADDIERKRIDYRVGCYKNQKNGNYAKISDYLTGTEVALGAGLQVKGQLLNKKIAAIEAAANGRFARTSILTIRPLSVDLAEGGTAGLRDWNRGIDACRLIGEVLDRRRGGLFLVSQVLHGQVRHLLRMEFGGELSLGAQSDVVRKIVQAFGISKASVRLSSERASFQIAGSPAPMSLAIVPENINANELRRITYYLRGRRGAALEIAVLEATQATELSAFETVKVRINEILGDEIANRERWVERFVNGRELMDIASFRERTPDNIDMQRVGNYAAAMVLIR